MISFCFFPAHPSGNRECPEPRASQTTDRNSRVSFPEPEEHCRVSGWDWGILLLLAELGSQDCILILLGPAALTSQVTEGLKWFTHIDLPRNQRFLCLLCLTQIGKLSCMTKGSKVEPTPGATMCLCTTRTTMRVSTPLPCPLLAASERTWVELCHPKALPGARPRPSRPHVFFIPEELCQDLRH